MDKQKAETILGIRKKIAIVESARCDFEHRPHFNKLLSGDKERVDSAVAMKSTDDIVALFLQAIEDISGTGGAVRVLQQCERIVDECIGDKAREAIEATVEKLKT